MKKLSSLFLVLMSLLVITGCGSQFTESGDNESLYPYSWKVNSDNSLTIKIDGQWENDHAWRAEYDDTLLACEVGKKGNTFTFRSLDIATTEIDLRLYGGENEENWEYDIWLLVQGDLLGGVNIITNTHLEGTTEGEYSYTNDEEGNILFRIETDHEWDCRTNSEYTAINRCETGDGYVIFKIVTNEMGEGNVDIYDLDSPLLLSVDTIAVSGGNSEVSKVETLTDTAFGERNLDAFWEQVGFMMRFPHSVEITDAAIERDEEYMFPCGTIDMTINGQEFCYYVSLDSAWIKEHEPVINQDYGYADAPAIEIVAIGDVEPQIYTQEGMSKAIWGEYGAFFAMEGDCDKETFIAALKVLLGG